MSAATHGRRGGPLPVGEASAALSDRRGPRSGDLFWYAALPAWLALAAGLLEPVLLLGKRLVLDRMLFVGTHVVWTSAVAHLALFAPCAVALFLLSRLSPRLASPRVSVFAFTFLGSFGLLFLFHPELHKMAGLLLATGISAQLARVSTAHPRALRKLVSRTGVWMVAAVAMLAVGHAAHARLVEHRNLAQLPAPTTGAPNLLLIILDTVRARSLSAYGHAEPTTPQLERFARSGARFDLAIAPAPWTLPTHASIFTGQWPHALSTSWGRALDGAYPTLAEILREHGYETAGFVANTNYASYETGLNRGFIRYEDYPVSAGAILRSSSLGRFLFGYRSRFRQAMGTYAGLGRKDAAQINHDFLGWLSRRDARRPFFAFLNYFDAHWPYEPPEPYRERFGATTASEAAAPGTAGDSSSARRESVDAARQAYEGSIAYLDEQLGRLLEELDRRGLRENTLVIITSDHGEEFDEHGMVGHGYSLYLPVLHVPLLVAFPGRVPEGIGITQPVSLRDIPATALELLGIDHQLPSLSLTRFWATGAVAAAGPVLSEVSAGGTPPEQGPLAEGDLRSLVGERFHYIASTSGRKELYEWTNDPLEQFDLADEATHARTLSRLSDELRSLPPGGSQPAETMRTSPGRLEIAAKRRDSDGVASVQ